MFVFALQETRISRTPRDHCRLSWMKPSEIKKKNSSFLSFLCPSYNYLPVGIKHSSSILFILFTIFAHPFTLEDSVLLLAAFFDFSGCTFYAPPSHSYTDLCKCFQQNISHHIVAIWLLWTTETTEKDQWITNWSS